MTLVIYQVSLHDAWSTKCKKKSLVSSSSLQNFSYYPCSFSSINCVDNISYSSSSWNVLFASL